MIVGEGFLQSIDCVQSATLLSLTVGGVESKQLAHFKAVKQSISEPHSVPYIGFYESFLMLSYAHFS